MPIQVIQEKRKPTFAEKMNLGLERGMQGMSQVAEQYQKHQSKQSMEKLFGPEVANLPHELQKEYVSKHLQGGLEERKQQIKYQNQINMMKQLGLDFGEGEGQQQEQPQMNAQEPNQGMSGNEQPQPEPKQGQRRPNLYSQSKINAMALVNPAVADKMQKRNDQIREQERHEETIALRKQERSPEVIREQRLSTAQAEADVKYNQELQAAHKQHEIKTSTLNRLEDLNKKGITGKPYEKMLEKFGLVNLTSEGRREFAADVKNLITDIRSILGGQFSTFEFQTILNAYPSADFSQTANEAIIKNLKEFQDIRNQEFKIAKNIKSENGGKIPEDFQSRVNDRLQEYAQSKLPQIKQNTQEIMREQLGVAVGNTILLAPDGEPIAVPNEDVERVLQLGAQMP